MFCPHRRWLWLGGNSCPRLFHGMRGQLLYSIDGAVADALFDVFGNILGDGNPRNGTLGIWSLDRI